MYAIEVTFDGKKFHTLRESRSFELLRDEMESFGDLTLCDQARVRLIARDWNLVLQCQPKGCTYDVVNRGLQKLAMEKTGEDIFRCERRAWEWDDADCAGQTASSMAEQITQMLAENAPRNRAKHLEEELRQRLAQRPTLPARKLRSLGSDGCKGVLRRSNKATLWYIVREILSYLEVDKPEVHRRLLTRLSAVRPEIDDVLRVKLPAGEPTVGL